MSKLKTKGNIKFAEENIFEHMHSPYKAIQEHSWLQSMLFVTETVRK